MRWQHTCAALLGGWSLAASSATPTAYEDREIPADTLPAAVDDLSWAQRDYDAEGVPRTFSAELKFQGTKLDSDRWTSARWVVLQSSFDTLNHGFITLDVSRNLGEFDELPGASRYREPATITLLQRGVPWTGGWVMNNGLGIIQPSNLDLIAQQYRFGLPTRLVLGASNAWQNNARGLGFQGSLGSTVALDPLGQAGYGEVGGQVYTLGARYDMPERGLRYAAQWATHTPGGDQHLPVGVPDLATARRLDPSSRGFMQSLRIDQTDRSAQLNLLVSRNDADPADKGWRTGAWVDASWNLDTVEQRFGVNVLPRNQRWAGLPMASGAEGGYYRWRWRTRQLTSEFQIDSQRFLGAGDGPDLRYHQLWSNQRWQLNRSRAVGLQATALHSNGSTRYDTLVYLDQLYDNWTLRGLTGVRGGGDQAREGQFGADVSTTWMDTQFSATAIVFTQGRDAFGSDLSINASRSLSERLSFGLGARRFNAIDSASAGDSISLTTQYRLSAGWTFSAALSDSHGARVLQPAGVNNNAPTLDPFVTFTPRQQYAFITLRYDWNAGLPGVPLGAAPGSNGGSGTVTGLVFLDANGNGAFDPGEQPVPQVLVALNNRFTVRTDVTGRFTFPSVATGSQTITLFPDNIPLPWFLGSGTEQTVTVTPRGVTDLRFGATTN